MIVRCVIAGEGINGPDLWFVKVNVSEEQYDQEEHREIAKRWAEEQGVDELCVVLDEYDNPKSLFDLFVWESASII